MGQFFEPLYISHYGRGGDLASLNEEIWPSVAYSWHESPLGVPHKCLEWKVIGGDELSEGLCDMGAWVGVLPNEMWYKFESEEWKHRETEEERQ